MSDFTLMSPLGNSIIDNCRLCARARVFHAVQAQGNIATCFILDRPPAAGWPLANAGAAGETWCLLWKGAQAIHAVALQHGSEIHFCGHGLVAAGYFWFLNYGELPVLATQYGSYATRQSDEYFSIAAPRLYPTPTNGRINQRYKKMFDSAPMTCFCVGGDNDYLLCIWPPGVDIATVKINFELIATQARAVVMTQSVMTQSVTTQYAITQCNVATLTKHDAVIPFDLRYLAPQYGENEGSATGSAAAIAANYWHLYLQALPGQRFVAYQRSSTGGEINCTVEKNSVWIGGRVAILPNS